MNRQKMFKKFIIIFALLVSGFFCLGVDNVHAQEGARYYPYPIIFVHGLDSSSLTWNDAKDELNAYFSDDAVTKYFPCGARYLTSVDYSFMSSGDIQIISRTVLKNKIDEIIKTLPDDYRKVIVVVHSMGGLVVRSLLDQHPEYDGKIHKVVFMGTPHLGSPGASALWILDELNVDNDLVTKYTEFYSPTVLTPYQYDEDTTAYLYTKTASRFKGLKGNISCLLRLVENCGPRPSSIAIEQLRVAGNVNYNASISYSSSAHVITAIISHGHTGAETFLGQHELTNPSNFRVIRGINYGYGRKKSLWLNYLLDNHSDNFTFPVLKNEVQSLENAKDTGDGIVTRKSQEGIGDADYAINAFHTDETEDWQTILQAIEDKPEIENIGAIGVDERDNSDTEKEYYIKVKVKDYLLADIEIETMTLDGVDIIPANFNHEGKYKPYYAPENEYLKFLMERKNEATKITDLAGNSKSLSLLPGEFYVKVTMNPTEEHEFYIKIKNPAEEFAQDDSFTAEETAIIPVIFYPNFAGSGVVTRVGEEYPADWANCRNAASGTLGQGACSGAIAFLEAYVDYRIGRAFLTFDTSSIPDNAVITSATLGLYNYGSGGIGQIGLTQSTQANPENLTAEDYNNVTLNLPPEVAARISPAGEAGDLQVMTLNATGLTWINKTGYTKFCLRVDRDIDNGPVPTGPISSDFMSGYSIYHYRRTEGGNDYCPYLAVIYEWEKEKQ